METKTNLISKTRLISQKLASPEFKTPSDIVKYMGAMQSQDFLMAKWAIGVRLKEPIDTKVVSAIDNGEILRIHVLRPIWHIVTTSLFKPPDDSTIKKIEMKVRDFGRFLGKETELIQKTE